LNDSADRNPHNHILGSPSFFMVTAAMAAVAAEKMTVVLKIQEREQVVVGAKNNISALSPVSAVGLSLALILVAVEAFTPFSSASRP
jgi:ABC-type transport system involved in cytochrome c biogenesis permease subunit